METINFFKDEEKIEEKCFGLCDDFDEQAKTPAYCSINLEEKENWIATVSNKTDNSIAFIAVNNKIELRRANGEMDYRCDAMLHNEDYIVFVELKNQRENWIKHAVEDQLLSTINAFKNAQDITQFKHKVAYACNKKQPKFAVSHKQYMNDFKRKNDVRLIISNEITLK